jgi:hypothetical protein
MAVAGLATRCRHPINLESEVETLGATRLQAGWGH